jgi:hypothetical protein
MYQSTIVYELSESLQVKYVIPVSSIPKLGLLPLVPVGNTWTMPYKMRRELAYFPGASCDQTKDRRTDVEGGQAGVVHQQLGPGMDWEPSNDGNKQMKTSNLQLHFWICRICK